MSGPLDNFLERFRRTAGVPAAVGGDVASELAPVFAALDEIEQEAAELRVGTDAARADHDARLERELAGILADARARAERARQAAYEEARELALANAREIVAEGERDAAEIRERGSSRLPVLVEEIVSRISGKGL